jgi:hypothetical protein
VRTIAGVSGSRPELDAEVRLALRTALQAEGVDPDGRPDYHGASAGVKRFLRENPVLAKRVIGLYEPLRESPEDDDLPDEAFVVLWLIDQLLRESGDEGLPSVPPTD